MMFGTPHLRRELDHTDRIGLRRLVLSLMWQPSRARMTQIELDAETPGAPEVSGGMLLTDVNTTPSGGVMRTGFTYEGINGDGKTITFKTRGNSRDFEFQPGFAQVSLLKHPKIQQLLKLYSGRVIDAEIIWPPSIKASGGGAGEKDNPLFGEDDFFRLEGTYTYRYAALSLSGIDSGVGKIHESGGLPGQAPSYKGRNWLKLPPPWRHHGLVYEIVEMYWLSGDGGWPKPVYGALAASGFGGGGIQTSGPLQTGSL